MEENSDIAVFNQLFKEQKNRFIRFAYTYVRDWSVAEDFTVESFIYYWENRRTLSPDSNISSYILTIVKHKCLNYLEHQKVKETFTEKMKEHAEWELNTRISTLKACDPEELFNSEVHEIIKKTLNSLPKQSRLIFVMSRYRNKSHKEIASYLNISTKTVEFHISKALKALRHSLRDYFI